MSDGDPLRVAAATATAGDLKQLVSEMIIAWPSSAPFDAWRILDLHPELHGNRSALLDLAYEEFCRRTEAGEMLSSEAFAQTFPGIQVSLLHQLRVHRFLAANTRLDDILPIAKWPSPGDHFLGFDLREEIGRGGLSRVYLASERSIGGRTVVVKVSEFGGDEAQVLGKLDHPGIVPIYSVRRDDRTGLCAICMPYLGRATLLAVLDARAELSKSRRASRQILRAAAQSGGDADMEPAPPLFRRGNYIDKVLQIGLQLAEALQFAHGAGICHGDLKPSNVLLTNDGRALLLDFNLAFGQNAANSGRVGGTLPYMAPEQLRIIAEEPVQNAERPGGRADLFSLGAVLYELMTGSLPFGDLPTELSRRDAVGELLRRQARGPRPLSHIQERVDPRICEVIHRCLAVDPCERPESAEQLAAELRRMLSARRRVCRWLRAHAAASITAVLLASACSAAVAFAPLTAAPSSDGLGRMTASEEATRVHLLDGLLASGMEALQASDHELAIRRFNEALDRHPNWLPARFWRGRALLLSGEHQKARTDFQAVLHERPSAAAVACVGFSYSLDKAHPAAIACYRQAIAQGLSTAAIWTNLAYSYRKTGELVQAEECLDRAMEADPKLPAIYHNRSQIEFNRGLQRGDPDSVRWLQRALSSGHRAREYGGESGALWLDTACICARLASETADPAASRAFERAAVQATRNAATHGVDRRARQAVIALLQDSEELREAVECVPHAGTRHDRPDAFTVLLTDPLIGAECGWPGGADVRVRGGL
jgi:serine/threonine protein kinase/Tfp pilus assembly protein PilF